MEQTALNDTPVILMFLKAPRAGYVKTRLAADIGDAAAVEVYKQLVRCQVAEIPGHYVLEIHYTPEGSAEEIRKLAGSSRQYAMFPQPEDDLGKRLDNAFRGASSRHPGKPLLAIGGDCPDLSGSLLDEAARSLSEFDLVLGPAVDGGYYLIGMHDLEPSLFENITWSSPAVFEQTRHRAERAGLNCFFLPRLEDVDDLPSLKRVRPEFLGTPDIPTGNKP